MHLLEVENGPLIHRSGCMQFYRSISFFSEETFSSKGSVEYSFGHACCSSHVLSFKCTSTACQSQDPIVKTNFPECKMRSAPATYGKLQMQVTLKYRLLQAEAKLISNSANNAPTVQLVYSVLS